MYYSVVFITFMQFIYFMSDDVININIEDIAQILATTEIYKPLTFGYFYSEHCITLILWKETRITIILMTVVFITFLNSLEKLLWTCLFWVFTHGQVTIYLKNEKMLCIGTHHLCQPAWYTS